MYNTVKHKDIKKLDHMTDESRAFVRSSVKLFPQRYHLGPKIDIIIEV